MNQEAIQSPYVDYKYYTDEYGGTYIQNDKDFKRAEKLAEAFVNQVTFGRIPRLLILTDSIKDAVCSAADTIALQGEKKKSLVKSESNDGYSVSYADAASDTSVRKEMLRNVRTYLANTGLLYKGWVKEHDDKCRSDHL